MDAVNNVDNSNADIKTYSYRPRNIDQEKHQNTSGKSWHEGF